MTAPQELILEFGPFRLLPGRRGLFKDGQPVALGGRSLDILAVLVERPGEIVGKDEVTARVWPGATIDDANLRVHVAALRKALGTQHDFIKSVIGRGYCFVAPVAAVGSTVAAPSLSPSRMAHMIGRDATIDLLARRLRMHRLVTVVGPGGVGKSTVAAAVASAVAGSDGASSLDIATIHDPLLLPSALAAVLGVAADGDAALPAVIDFLRSRSGLLVLDNCDGLVGPVAALADAILRGTEATRLIVTSREPLRMDDEWVHRLATLECPATAHGMTLSDAMGYAAIRMFVERATAVWDAFAPTDADVPVLATICRRLDGVPLALELAAGHVGSLGLRTMADNLEGRYILIMRGRRTAVPRHQTLGAMLDSTYDCLSESEQALLRRLGALDAPAPLGAIAAMARGMAGAPFDVTAIVQSLVEKSLLISDGDGEAACLRLLGATRIYARERSREAGEDAGTVLVHQHATPPAAPRSRGALEAACR
jgi:predicted ATPase/DNA-binding winged helix-turn-helix (wHTH) protein